MDKLRDLVVFFFLCHWKWHFKPTFFIVFTSKLNPNRSYVKSYSYEASLKEFILKITWSNGNTFATEFYSLVYINAWHTMIHQCLLGWIIWRQIMMAVKCFGCIYPLMNICWIRTWVHSVYPFRQKCPVVWHPRGENKLNRINMYIQSLIVYRYYIIFNELFKLTSSKYLICINRISHYLIIIVE